MSATLRDNENLSNERRQETLVAGLGPSQREQLSRLRHYFAEKDVIGSDPPDHNRIRRLVAQAFTPRTIAGLQPRITEVAAELLTEALGPGQPFDFVAAISHPLPVIVIAEVLGAPVADRPLFKKWSADILGFQGTGTTTGEVLSGPGQLHRAVRLHEHAHRRPQAHASRRRHHRARPRRGGPSAAHARRAAGILQHAADRRA